MTTTTTSPESPRAGRAAPDRRRSAPPLSAVVKLAMKILSRPDFARAMAMLQVDKHLFPLLRAVREPGHGGKIRQLSLRITDMCNLRCHTCGQWGDSGYLRDRPLIELKKREVGAERYRFLLEDLAQHGHKPVLYFWGGEPMLYPGLADLVDVAARLGMPPTIATNGTHLVRDAERFAAAPMALVQISIDGSRAETHNDARPGVSPRIDNFATVLAGCAKIREARGARGRGLPLVVTLTTISRANYGDLVAIYERFADVADLCIFYLSWWIDQEHADAHTADFERRFGERPSRHYGWIGEWSTFDVATLAEQLDTIRARAKAKGRAPAYIMPDLAGEEALRSYYTDHQARFGFSECASIYTNPEIDSDGSLSPCRDYHDYVVGNVKERTISELWNAERYVRFRRSITEEGLMPVCARCCGLMGY